MLATISIFTLFASRAALVIAHASFLGIHGSNGIVGTGFAVDRFGWFNRHGQGRDAGGDVTIFQEGVDMPDPPCGVTPYIGGPIDTASWLNNQEGYGVPAANADGTLKMTLFQVNADGGGPAKCEYCSDASLTDSCWKPLKLVVNQPGENGILRVTFTNHTLIAKFPADAMCTGGIYGDTCIARCRTGVNGQTGVRYRFGGCFAVRLAAHVKASTGIAKRHHQLPQDSPEDV